MIRIRLIGLVAGLTLLTASLSALAAANDLERYFSDVRTLHGEFSQETHDEDGRLLEESEGYMWLARPNRFHWRYDRPYEQQIVADGERIWVYDVDLLQVSVRPLDEVLGSGPALLLSGELDTLQELFRVREEDDWLVLEPGNGGWEMEEARLRFRDGVPVEVVILDGLGQTTRLRMDELAVNESIDDTRFRFEPPPEADVIGADGQEW